MAATATVQSRSKGLFPMPSFKGAAAKAGSLRSFTRAASPAPSASSRRDEPPSPSAYYATAPSGKAGSSSSIKSGRSLTGSLLSIRSLGKIASFGARLGARARPAHPPPETFTYLKDLVLVDEPEDMDMDMRCGGEGHMGAREDGAERGAFWGKQASDDDERQRQGQFSPSMSVSVRPQNLASAPSPIPSSSPHDDHPAPHDMPTRTHTLPPGAPTPAPTMSRTESGTMNTAINPSAAPENTSDSGPSSGSSNSNNPLQRPRSKSRTIIRMLTTKFSHPHTPTAAAAHDTPTSPTTSNPHPHQPSSSPAAAAATHTHALHLKIPKPSKPKAPPKVAPTAFADPAARAAALRARGLLPPLPVLDLSEQERERDARLPILEGHSQAQDSMVSEARGDAAEQGETAADRIKREWAARNGIELPTTNVNRVEDDVVEATEAVVDAGAEADPQRARMRAFKFGGGSAPSTPTLDVHPAAQIMGAPGLDAAKTEDAPVTPVALDFDVSLIDFSEPAHAPTPVPVPVPAMVVETAQTSPLALLSSSLADAAHTITATAGEAQGSTATLITAPRVPLSVEADLPAPGSPAALEAESVSPISIEISPPGGVAAPMTAAVPTAGDSDNGRADSDRDVRPRSPGLEEEDTVSGVVLPLPRALPVLPPSATAVAEEDGVEAADVEELEEKQDKDAELTSLPPRPPTPSTPSKTLSRTVPTPPTSPSFRAAFIQTPPATPPPVRNLPPVPGAATRALPSLPVSTPSSPPASTISYASKNLQPLPMAPSLSSDTQMSSESVDSVESSNSDSTAESASILTPSTPAFASSNNPFANPSSYANDGTPRAAPIAKGKLGNLSVKTQGGVGILPVLVHSPATESMQGIPLEVVQEESQDGAWLDSQATTPAAVHVEKNPADELLESMGLGAFARGLAEDNSLALGLGLDTRSPGIEQAVAPTSPTLPTPVSPTRVPAVTISTPAAAGETATPRNKKRGMTDPGARKSSLFGGFRKGDGDGADGAPQRRVSVVASLDNLRRSVVGTISGGADKKERERERKAASRSRSPRRFDASHLPPSPSPFTGFSTANANAGVNVNVNDAYRSDGMPGSPRTTSSHGSGSVLSHANSTYSKTVLAPGSAPQLRRGAAPGSPMQRRTAVEPVMYSRGSILLEAANIEDEETRRMTEMAFLG